MAPPAKANRHRYVEQPSSTVGGSTAVTSWMLERPDGLELKHPINSTGSKHTEFTTSNISPRRGKMQDSCWLRAVEWQLSYLKDPGSFGDVRTYLDQQRSRAITLFSRRNVINGRKDLRCMLPFLYRSGLSKDAS